MLKRLRRDTRMHLDDMAFKVRSSLNSRTDPDERGPYKIFIIGSGRSGTHWLGYILESFPAIHVTIEKKPIFPWVIKMARDPAMEDTLFPRLVERYRIEHRGVLPHHYADKSHPNLFLAERLRDEFPEARFIGIIRKLEGTVASMMIHEGALRPLKKWDEDPRPSRFLGVTPDLVDDYRGMSTAARLALRVITHAREVERKRAVLGDRMHVIEYEALARGPDEELSRLSTFLGLPVPPNPPRPNPSALTKWRQQLREDDLADIQRVAERFDATDLLWST